MSSDDRFDQFIRSAGEFGAPAPEDLQRVKASLSARLPVERELSLVVSETLRASTAAASPTRTWLRGRFFKLAAFAVSAVTLSAGVYTVTSSRTTASLDASPSATDSSDVTPPSTNLVVANPAVSADQPVVLSIDNPAKLPDAAAHPPAVPAKARLRSGTLDAEVALLAEASAALHTNPARSLALVDQHAREFPSGVLGPEFEAERAQVLSALGRRAEACAASARFLAAHPNSPLAPQVRASCDDENR